MNPFLNWCARASLAGACLLAAPLALADAVPASVSPAVAAKLAWRGEAPDMAVPEIRVARKGGFLSVQSDLRNGGEKDQALYYRYRWLDQHGLLQQHVQRVGQSSDGAGSRDCESAVGVRQQQRLRSSFRACRAWS